MAHCLGYTRTRDPAPSPPLNPKRKVPEARVVKHDLRLPLYLKRRFDMVAMTEVVEHVEPVFSSQIILNAILHSDVIWFSYKHASAAQKATLFHPNEAPEKQWTSLFAFYGYNCVLMPAKARSAVRYRGDLIAYNASNPALHHLSTDNFTNFSIAVDPL